MSSSGRIIIAPKKKKKKPLIIVSKKKKSISTATTAKSNISLITTTPTTRPASPDTVAAAAADASSSSCSVGPAAGNTAAAAHTLPNNNINNKPSSKKPRSSGGILIKPFERPPALPTDFYDSSLEVLRRALTCVLRHEALLAPSNAIANENANNNKSGGGGEELRLVGREELYRSVEDLCVHKFGIQLYSDVVRIVEGAAGEVVHRLADRTTNSSNSSNNNSNNNGDDRGELDAIADSITGDVGYDAVHLVRELNLTDGGCGRYDPTENAGSEEESSRCSEKRYALLRRMHATVRTSYASEYLTFVRSIFLALDRAYVYFADVELDEIGGGAIGVPSASPPGGRIVERSSGLGYSNNSRVWGLWEVGVACLRKHMLRRPTATKALASSSSVVGGAAGAAISLGTLSVLTTMVLTTAYAILSEYDDRSFSSSSNAMSVGGDVRPLVQNCVRTIIDLGALPSLLEELIVVASGRFEKEGNWWGGALGERDGGGSRKSRIASEFLLHVENRLRQSLGLTLYYLPSNKAAVAALRQLSKLPSLSGAVPSASSAASSTAAAVKKVVWSPANCTTRRILPAIIEKQLLSPHIVPTNGGILEPRHLYPMLDDDDDATANNTEAWKSHSRSNDKMYENAKRLYGLCWRMTVSMPPSPETSAAPMSSGNPRPSSALDHLRIAFGEYGRLRGSEIVKQGLSKGSSNNAPNKEMEKKIIPDLLAFKNHLNSLHAVAFRNDDSFGAMVRSVLEDVLNGATATNNKSNDDSDGGRRIAELLAKHVDARFKDAKAQAAPTASSSSVPRASLLVSAIAADASESFQSEILSLFRHVHSKDVFEAFYKRDLAKRLLTGRAVSTDMERSFLSKLKAECGAGYTSKMEGMFKDMELSRDIMGSYTAYASSWTATSGSPNAAADVLSPSVKAVDMDVQVLTTGYWPVYPKYPNIILPSELLALRTKFETYYNDKYQGRRIAWQYSLGNCIVKATFPKSPAPKELIVNVCQSLVLLCFRHDDGDDGLGLTLDEILKRTGIEDRSELERVLQSLSMGRDGTRVLKKVDYDSPPTKTGPSPKAATGKDGNGSPRKAKKPRVRRNVDPQDRFLFNALFSSNQRRIRITNITMKETFEERTKTHETVSKDRLYFIDAAVVRIMKARKTIDHRMLIGEVLAQLKFPAASADIKKRIESLIEREYMERVEGDISKYKYLA